MNEEEQLKRLEEIRTELFTMANQAALAEDKIDGLGRQLHKSSNAVTKAVLMIEGDQDALERYERQEANSVHTEMMYEALKIGSPEMFKH